MLKHMHAFHLHHHSGPLAASLFQNQMRELYVSLSADLLKVMGWLLNTTI
jgi:hypothetical protein